MKKSTKTLFIVLLLVSAIFTSAFQSADPQGEDQPEVRLTQIDTSEFPSVTLYLSVVDAEGNPVEVSPSRLVIEENGQPIDSSMIEGVGEVGPLTTLLVTDISGSMNNAGKLEAAQAAAHRYVDQMRPGDQAGLLVFNTESVLAQEITASQDTLHAAIDAIRARDNTAMYDALVDAVELLESVEGRKAIIVLTDGLDNISETDADDVITAIGTSGLSISTIGLGEQGQSTSAITALDEHALISLAEQAGGVYGYAEDEESLARLYEQYALALQSEYVITYTSPADLRDGVARSLSVSLSDATGAVVVSQSEDGYNPGGLIPEVAQPAAWPLFFAVLGGLLLLLLIPAGIGMLGGLGERRRKPRIKLMD
jgi:VWFA-related protein